MQILNNTISALNMRKSQKFSHLQGNPGWRMQWRHHIFDWKWKYGRYAHAQWKICNI